MNNTETNKKPVKKVVLTVNGANLEYTPSEEGKGALADGTVTEEDLNNFEKELNKDAASTGVYRYLPKHDYYANNPYPFD